MVESNERYGELLRGVITKLELLGQSGVRDIALKFDPEVNGALSVEGGVERGSSKARVVFAVAGKAEASGEEAELLDRMIKAMKLDEASYEVATLRGEDLRDFISSSAPEVVVAFGKQCACEVLGAEEEFSRIRGHLQELGSVKVMPTHVPASLLKDPSLKKESWEDLKSVMRVLGLKPGS